MRIMRIKLSIFKHIFKQITILKLEKTNNTHWLGKIWLTLVRPSKRIDRIIIIIVNIHNKLGLSLKIVPYFGIYIYIFLINIHCLKNCYNL